MAGRQAEIQELQRVRGNPVIAFVTGDRHPITASIGDDAVRPLFDVLRGIGKVETLDVFLYSRGGGTEVPWRIASALRQYADKWNALVPYRANSAATLLALGADRIVLGPHGELGPIDPILKIQRAPGTPGQPGGLPQQDDISVEDVMAYFNFLKDQVGLTDQSTLAEGVGRLAERLDAVGLGSVYRIRSHIRDVAHRMLTSQQNPPSERAMETIVETLAERVYAHGHAIGINEARDIGLPVDAASEDEEAAIWSLLGKYEEDLKLREPIDPIECIQTNDKFVDDLVIAALEGESTCFEFQGTLDVRAIRQMPQTLNVALNLNPQLPAGLDPNQLPAEAQNMLQQLVNELLPIAHESVNEALTAQAPVIGADIKFLGSKWTRIPTPDLELSGAGRT